MLRITDVHIQGVPRGHRAADQIIGLCLPFNCQLISRADAGGEMTTLSTAT